MIKDTRLPTVCSRVLLDVWSPPPPVTKYPAYYVIQKRLSCLNNAIRGSYPKPDQFTLQNLRNILRRFLKIAKAYFRHSSLSVSQSVSHFYPILQKSLKNKVLTFLPILLPNWPLLFRRSTGQ